MLLLRQRERWEGRERGGAERGLPRSRAGEDNVVMVMTMTPLLVLQ